MFVNTPPLITHRKLNGFTLIEVMLVIVVVGVLMSAVQFTFQGNQSEEQLENASKRFAAVFDIASEYGMLNNLELGLYVTEESYQFLAFDGTQWVELPDEDSLQNYQLPENIILTLSLDDLPVEGSLLANVELFQTEDDDFREEEKEKIQPQVVILSGGEISPFSITFQFDEAFNAEPISYKVTGLYSTPLTIEGPIDG